MTEPWGWVLLLCGAWGAAIWYVWETGRRRVQRLRWRTMLVRAICLYQPGLN